MEQRKPVICGSPNTGDLDLSGDGTTILGGGSGTTFIKGTTPNDRVMCVDAPLLGSFDFTMSGVTVFGGRDTSGSRRWRCGDRRRERCLHALTPVVMTNNRTERWRITRSARASASGAGSLTVTNSTIGGTVAAGTPVRARLQTNCGNQSAGSGAGIYQSVTNDTNKNFILSNSVIQNNNDSTGGNGAGAK